MKIYQWLIIILLVSVSLNIYHYGIDYWYLRLISVFGIWFAIDQYRVWHNKGTFRDIKKTINEMRETIEKAKESNKQAYSKFQQKLNEKLKEYDTTR